MIKSKWLLNHWSIRLRQLKKLMKRKLKLGNQSRVRDRRLVGLHFLKIASVVSNQRQRNGFRPKLSNLRWCRRDSYRLQSLVRWWEVRCPLLLRIDIVITIRPWLKICLDKHRISSSLISVDQISNSLFKWILSLWTRSRRWLATSCNKTQFQLYLSSLSKTHVDRQRPTKVKHQVQMHNLTNKTRINTKTPSSKYPLKQW